jgi:hypothetical protein
VGVVFGCCGMWCLMKSRGGKKRRMAAPLYEEPVKPVFSLTENQAYGQVAQVAHDQLNVTCSGSWNIQ